MAKANITRRQILTLASAMGLLCAWTNVRAQRPITILFICEHGYAKSVVAAHHFERLARARGLVVRTIARGADPGVQVPPGIAAGLGADGFSVAGFTPARASPSELQQADYVVLISADVDLTARSGPVFRWNDVSPLSENYARARDELVAHDTALLDLIQANGRQ